MTILDIAIVNVALSSIQRRPRVLPGEPAVGHQRVRARLRRLPVARRTLGRPARAPARLHLRDARLHARLAPLRIRLERGVSDRLPRVPGARGRNHHARSALHPRRDLQGRPRAQHRAGWLGRGRRGRRRLRRALRRHPRRLPVVAVDLLRQRPGRNRRADPDPVPPLREPRQARPGVRHPRRGARDVGSLDLRPRHHAGARLGLGVGEDDRRVRRSPRYCSSASSSGRAAWSTRSCRSRSSGFRR